MGFTRKLANSREYALWRFATFRENPIPNDIIGIVVRTPQPIEDLVTEFQKLPGIGPRTAERLTYWLLRAPQEQSAALAEAVGRLKADTVECSTCFNIAGSNPCTICADPQRDVSKIMVVEEPLDLIAIEKTGKYDGLYHVLGGVLNPVAGIGPEALRIGELLSRITHNVSPVTNYEIILATNPSMEGEATAMYLAKRLRQLDTENLKLKITRIARGLPTGADVEYADSVTLSRALEGRTEFDS